MEITSDDSIPGKTLVEVEFKLGTESYRIDANKGDTVLEQLVAMKEESMTILKEFITKHNNNNVPDDVESLCHEESEEEEEEEDSVKPKKTKI